MYLMKKYIAELIGTFGLVFFGTGSIIVNEISNGTIGLIGIALAFGLIVTVMIYIFENISGAHINPAVTIAFAVRKDIDLKETVFYIIFQIIGAILASVLLKVMFPTIENLGMTLPSSSISQSFIIEFVSTFFLMLTILGITQQGSEQSKSLTGIVIGFVVLAMIFVAGPISGGSFNPARSIGPAIVSGNLQHLWLYLVSPTLGAIFAVFIWKYLQVNK
ncbi:MAG TPA: MIP family channel protein [Flavobacteriaceae bacterium]|nr:MIP family channel protein [Flavobacteriaceae bacterium]HIP27122.1 MIP family channel protein [Flavobacteriaceae bacterium]